MSDINNMEDLINQCHEDAQYFFRQYNVLVKCVRYGVKYGVLIHSTVVNSDEIAYCFRINEAKIVVDQMRMLGLETDILTTDDILDSLFCLN